MNYTNPIRFYILVILVILSGAFFAMTIVPSSPLNEQNICMNNDMAKAKYESSNESVKNEFIKKRNDQCKELLKNADEPKTAYDKLDNCIMLDSVIDASVHYMDLYKKDKSAVRAELRYLSKYLGSYNYCPQYDEVVNKIKKFELESR